MEWSQVLQILGLVALVLVATWAHVAFWRWKLATPISYDEIHRVPLPCGSYAELRRLKPLDGEATADLPPILMVHGIAINHRNIDPTPKVSLARAAQRLGRDVWLLTLRSGRWDLTAKEKRGVTFASLAQEDIPVAVDFVLKATGAKHLDYLGFSMGGMLAYASFGRFVALEKVRRVVIMGSPGFVAPILPGSRMAAVVGKVWQPAVPARLFNGLTAFVAERVTSPIQHMFLNPRNNLPGMLHSFMIDATADIPGPLGMDMVRWAAKDGVVRVGDESALEGLRKVQVPVLFVAGGADKLGGPRAVGAAFDAWGGPKEFLLLAKSAGKSADYGHMDMITGPNAPLEVFHPILTFLGARA